MTWVAVAIAGSNLVGGLLSSDAQSSAADSAAAAQTQASQAGIAEQQRQFDAIQKLLAPFVGAGQQAVGSQQDLAGTNGAEAQQSAIDRLQQMPAFTSQLRLGENRILANASATGGLRGGNVQGALAYFAPQLLAQTINDQYARLGGLTSIGQNAAAGVGNAGMITGQGISGLLQQGGAAQAGSALAGGAAMSRVYNSLGGALGGYIGAGGQFGGIPTPDSIQGQFAQTATGSGGFGTGVAYGNQDYGVFI